RRRSAASRLGIRPWRLRRSGRHRRTGLRGRGSAGRVRPHPQAGGDPFRTLRHTDRGTQPDLSEHTPPTSEGSEIRVEPGTEHRRRPADVVASASRRGGGGETHRDEEHLMAFGSFGVGSLSDEQGPYAAWATRLAAWSTDPTTSLEGLPALDEQTFDRAT